MNSVQRIRTTGAALASGAAAVFFLAGNAPGVQKDARRSVVAGGVLLGLLCLAPHAAAGGLLALLAAQAGGRLAGIAPQTLRLPAHVYNPLLAGLAAGQGQAFSPAMLFCSILAGLAALLCTVVLAEILREHFALPALSLPFAALHDRRHLRGGAGVQQLILWPRPHPPEPGRTE